MTAFAAMMVLLGDSTASLSTLHDNDIVAGLLLVLLGIVLGMLLVFSVLMVRAMHRERSPTRRLPRHSEFLRDRRATAALALVPTRWIAIKSGNPHLVQAALGLANPKPCTWEEGLSATHDHKLFIAPPVNGWILVMGSSIPDPGDDVDKCFRFILDLSRKLGQVQFFSIHRAVNHHAWVRAESGVVQRAYAWAGRTLWNQGRLTRHEIELGLKCHAYGDGEDRIDYGRVDPAVVNTERVPLLAASWSLDPTTLDTRALKEHQGIAGRLVRSRAH